MSMFSVPYPIPYQGSKRKLAPAILGCFPRDVDVLYEPFCGSAAVTIAALATGRAEAAWINDSNEPLMNLWEEIVKEPKGLSEQYRELWVAQSGRERAFYDQVRDEFNRNHQPHHFLYLLARCVKAAVRYNAIGEFNQSPDNRRKGAHPDRMTEHITRASATLSSKVQMTSLNYRDALASATPRDLVYMDPPYQGVSTRRDRRYLDALSFEEFAGALKELNARDISYIISYDGRTGTKTHGKPLPETLHLEHFEVDGGRSTQATLLGFDHRTIESLYLSPALIERVGGHPCHLSVTFEEAPRLFAL